MVISSLSNPRIPPGDFAHENFDMACTTPPKTILLLYSTPRSGSTMVCDDVRRSGVCVMHEYFHPWDYRPALEERWNVPSNDSTEYLRQLIGHRTGPTGWLGINLHAHHIPYWEAVVPALPSSVQNIVEIRVRRKDVLSQAVSYYIAKNSGAWSSAYERGSDVPYDIDKIAQSYGRLRQLDANLDAYISKGNRTVPTFWYEDIKSDMSPVRDYLRIPAAPSIEKALIERQIDERKHEMVNRFRKDMRPTARLSRKLKRYFTPRPASPYEAQDDG